MQLPEIILYSKPNCCLCDRVKDQLNKLQRVYKFDWYEINILDDPADFEKFQHEIPVVFVDGQQAFKYHLDEKHFVQLLESAGRKLRDDSSSAS